jgi:nitrite reductase (NADH) large subunit
LGTRIVKIIPQENMVVSENGTKYGYDKLLMATGAKCFIPPIKGVDKPGVFSLRGVEDADNIKAYCQDITEVVVIGGGLLGLETAYSLKKLEKKVTVIEVSDRLLPRQLDNEGAAILRRMLEEKGLLFVLPGMVHTIEGDDKAEDVTLKSGERIKADAVIICSGIRVRVSLAREVGIRIEKGIVVNDYMQTSIDNIYCAGDPAEHNGKLYGLWPPAKEQGMTTGLNMAGVATSYHGTVYSRALKITGIDVYSAGDFDAENAEILLSKGKDVYRKLLLKKKDL